MPILSDGYGADRNAQVRQGWFMKSFLSAQGSTGAPAFPAIFGAMVLCASGVSAACVDVRDGFEGSSLNPVNWLEKQLALDSWN